MQACGRGGTCSVQAQIIRAREAEGRMQYRSFGRVGWQPSALGFGCMRFPADQAGKTDESAVERMLVYAVEKGVNYFDTSYVYGSSEEVIGRVLAKNGMSDRVKIATKLPPWQVNSLEDCQKMLAQQLSRLQREHIDLYLLHGLNRQRWEHVTKLGLLRWLRGKKKEGILGAVGFSFHDEYKVFQKIIDESEWDFCQVQYNYRDVDYQAGARGVRYAASKGIGVVVMEPLLGGQLVDPPAHIRALWDEAPVRRTPADWALQWLWDQEEVSVVLSGMSSMQQVEENVRSAEGSGVGLLTEKDKECIARVRGEYKGLFPIPCTGCGYCMPCPHGLNIPRNFWHYNEGKVHGQIAASRANYKGILTSYGAQAANCTACRTCEERCPQKIPISEWMPKVHAVLGEDKPYES